MYWWHLCILIFVRSIKCQIRPLVCRQCSVQLTGTNYRYKYSLLMTTLYQNPWLLGPKYSLYSHPKLAVFVLTLTYIMYSVHTYPDKENSGKFRPICVFRGCRTAQNLDVWFSLPHWWCDPRSFLKLQNYRL
jgi:hypothetical protein